MHPFKFLKRTSKKSSPTRSQSEPPGLSVTSNPASDHPSAEVSSRLTVSSVSPRDNTVTAFESHTVDPEVEVTEDVSPKKSATFTHPASLPEEHLESGTSPAASTIDLRGPWKSVHTEANVSKLDRSVQNTGAHTRGPCLQHMKLTLILVSQKMQ